MLETLGIVAPRCEDNTNARRDRAYPFVTRVISIFDDPLVLGCAGGAGGDSSFSYETEGEFPFEPDAVLVSDSPVELGPDEIAWVPVHRIGPKPLPNRSEAVLPVYVEG